MRAPLPVAVLAVLIVALLPRSTRAVDPPKLAVLVVVDQMRADYVERFRIDWTAGLKRLVANGAWFRRAAYPYFETFTCAGHATVSTGAFPRTHGIFQNVWWDREARRQVTCTEDPRASNVSYMVPAQGGDSAYRLQVPTFTDQMRTQRNAHVVSLALKARSAIMLAGHGGDAVTWVGDTVDGWETSSVYATEPVPAVNAFVGKNLVSADFGRTWNRLLPAARYTTADDAAGEAPPRGWTRTFPHALTGAENKADASFLTQWEASPFADALIGKLAATLVEELQLGRHATTDVLAVSFSSPDAVGHAFGPRSQEIRDMYAQLDRTLGTLFDRLDALVGRDQWVVSLTADHGVAVLPEQLAAEGKDAGRISASAIVNAVEERLRGELGDGRHLSAIVSSDLYFEPGVYDKLQASPALMRSVIDTIAAMPGVDRVLRSEEVRGATGSKDRLVRAAALSYALGRSGDLIVAPKPGWILAASGTTHGTANADDQQVPILFMGRGIKPGRYDQPATPADVSPTLAALCGITLSSADGRALTAALQ